jgi:hypothetical protein
VPWRPPDGRERRFCRRERDLRGRRFDADELRVAFEHRIGQLRERFGQRYCRGLPRRGVDDPRPRVNRNEDLPRDVVRRDEDRRRRAGHPRARHERRVDRARIDIGDGDPLRLEFASEDRRGGTHRRLRW